MSILKREVYSDGIMRMQMGMQDPATPVGEGIYSFHNDLMLVMIFVVVFVGVMLGRIVKNFEESKNERASKVVHGTVIEIVWTIIPALILMVVAIPSFTLLYAVDEVVEPSVTVKVIGKQWYWSCVTR